MTTVTQVVAAAFVLCAAHADADMSVERFLLLRKANPELALGFVDGLFTGMSWVNTDAEQRNVPPAFCPPRVAALGRGAALELFDSYLPKFRKMHKMPDSQAPTGLVMVLAIQDAFPCEGSR